MKFKIGDKVECQALSEGFPFSNNGKPLVIKGHYSPTSCYEIKFHDGSTCWAHESQLTLAKPEPKYKVGDMVAYSWNGYSFSGEIYSRFENTYTIRSLFTVSEKQIK